MKSCEYLRPVVRNANDTDLGLLYILYICLNFFCRKVFMYVPVDKSKCFLVCQLGVWQKWGVLKFLSDWMITFSFTKSNIIDPGRGWKSIENNCELHASFTQTSKIYSIIFHYSTCIAKTKKFLVQNFRVLWLPPGLDTRCIPLQVNHLQLSSKLWQLIFFNIG